MAESGVIEIKNAWIRSTVFNRKNRNTVRNTSCGKDVGATAGCSPPAVEPLSRAGLRYFDACNGLFQKACDALESLLQQPLSLLAFSHQLAQDTRATLVERL